MFYGLLLVVAVGMTTVAALPPCVCTRNYQPVCGSDGNTYDNQCMLDCAKTTKSDLTMAKSGKCPGADDLCICTLEYQPVCGSDGVTYPNKCSLNCQRSVRLVGKGACTQAESQKLEELSKCVCTREGRPVCGSDGITYGNPCMLNCATANNPKLSLKSHGPCVDEVKVVDQAETQSTCACTRNMQPVCGSDGVTYSNPCLLNCATAQNPSLALKSYGACVDANEVKFAELPADLACACTRNMRPVCGSDGKTYNNPCLLNCATKTNPALSMARTGSCEDVNVVEIPRPAGGCTCTRELAPVCGSDGETYSSACIMRCRNPAAQLAHDGPCEI